MLPYSCLWLGLGLKPPNTLQKGLKKPFFPAKKMKNTNFQGGASTLDWWTKGEGLSNCGLADSLTPPHSIVLLLLADLQDGLLRHPRVTRLVVPGAHGDALEREVNLLEII